MDSGVPGNSGVAVLRPVVQVVGLLGLGDVILQLQQRHALVTAVSLEAADIILVQVRYKIRPWKILLQNWNPK